MNEKEKKLTRLLLAGVDIDINKKVIPALTGIFGIGKSKSKIIALKLNIDNKRVYSLTEDEILALRKEINNEIVEEDLKRKNFDHIKDLIEMKCYRGIRINLGLPVNGQRTSSNAKTAKRNQHKHKD